jgi:hypothetical protein
MRSLLAGNRYTVETSSRYFPNINLEEALAQCFRIAYERNTSAAIRELREIGERKLIR